MNQDAHYLRNLVVELASQPSELEWLEFKMNNAEPQDIGEYISALANSAALAGKAYGYLLWGVDDGSHIIVGTSFNPRTKRVGNEELESWLLRQLSPKIGFAFHTVNVDGCDVVLLQVDRAFRHPVQFSNQSFIRIGSIKKKLKDFAERERTLWRLLDTTPFELLLAAEKLSADDVLKLLDYPAYFDLLDKPLPNTRDAILEALAADRLIESIGGAHWNVFNLGALLFAKRLADFGRLGRKTVRVVVYHGAGRMATVREHEGLGGYATGFKSLLQFIGDVLPMNEVIGQALRKSISVYPELAVRELVANAIIHQDFAVTGTGPMIEIFDDRMEITNPGKPLVDLSRLIDSPPRSRNESLASLLRRIGLCEERGSGVDKVVFECEIFQLPAPSFEIVGDSTRSVLFTPRALSKMDSDDRIRAVYQHACLRQVQRTFMTNTSLRERFGIDPKNSSTASRLLKEALAAEQVKLKDESASQKFRQYVPWWA